MLDRANFTLEDMDKHSLFHPLTSIETHMKQGPMIVEQSQGVRLRDAKGRSLIDCGAGLWCVNIGYGRPEIAEAAKSAIENLNYYHIFGGASNEPVIRLADKVLSLFHERAGAPQMARVFFGTSGSDANDTNAKLIRYYNNLRGKPEKKKIIARSGAYHGLTTMAAAMTGIEVYHKAWDLADEGVLHTSCPHYYHFAQDGETEEQFTDRLIAEIEAMIAAEGAHTIAAFIAEPIMGTGGAILPPKGYFAKLQPILEKNDILFIADEVITGFGRTGDWFATGLYGLKPDVVTLAKGITSAYFPVSASVISQKIWDVLEQASPEYGPVMHGFTYSGHPVGAAIGLANLKIMEEEKLPENSASVGAYLLQSLKERFGDHPFIGEIRGQGLMAGMEFVADKATKRFFKPGSNPHRLVGGMGAEFGIMIRGLPFTDTLAFSPPLCITAGELDEAMDGLAKALDKAMPELTRLAAEA